MEVHNYMEDIVMEVLNGVISERKNVCKCEKCKLEIAVWTLNHLPCIYIVTPKGIAYSRIQGLNIQWRTDVVREIINAIEHIKNYKLH